MSGTRFTLSGRENWRCSQPAAMVMDRRTLLGDALAAACLPVTGVAARESRLPIGSNTQFLIDDALVRSQEGLERVQNKPVDGRIVLANDRPWEQRIFYPDVIQTGDGGYRMYYNTGLTGEPGRNDVSVATSSDGLHFVKPPLSNVGIGGIPTNIVFPNAHGPAIGRCGPHPEIPFRLAFGMRGGMGLATSRDGWVFTPDPADPVIANKADTKQSLVWDPSISKWIWFSRCWEKPVDGRPGWSRFNGQIRAVARFESADGHRWSGPQVVARRTAADPLLSDFYGLQVTCRHGLMIGFLWVSDWDDLRGSVGRQRAELVVSRDHGLSWYRVAPHDPYFDLGPKGAFDGEIAWPTSILSRGDEDLIYYQGSRIEHAIVPVAQFPPDAYRLGVRTIGRDRFVGRRAGERTGTLLTSPLLLPSGSRPHVNFIAQPDGYVRIAVLSPAGDILVPDSEPLGGDRYDAEVRWHGDLGRIHGRPVCLRFTMHNATLFTFACR